MLHGFPGTPAELSVLAEVLSAGGLEVHVPLLPGFGLDIGRLKTTPWQAWVVAARDAWAALQEGAEQAFLLGFSMGGAVALKLVAALPANMCPDHLVLVAPFSRFADLRARALPLAQYVLPQLRPFQRADFSSEVVRAQFRRLEPTLDLDDPAVQRALKEQVVLPTASLVQLQRLGGSAYRAAPGITTPTLVLQGRDDTTVALADTRRLAVRLGGPLTYTELPGSHELIAPHEAGHRELLGWLERVFRVS